ncbi:helix-turn-helix domain-containing protein [Dysgonomonas sp. 520]|uniref:helix-turn-helix domain-containing protein n=1 Tax=Dysgonomonas sp. 520 TaxID=2302931 RepID=UPI0013D86F82|nr:helix-turn-helix domain-containing protein [Dysgonomonas sp. 520]
MSNNIRTSIINKLLELMPPQTKPVDYLSDILDISKESAYRRLSGKMSFDIEELVTLSEELGFSLDELVALSDRNSKIVIDIKVEKDPKQGFMERMKRFKKSIDDRLSDEYSYSVAALNYLPSELCVHYNNLFKLSYYIWLYWKDQNLHRTKYSEVEISPELEKLRKSIESNVKQTKNNTLILDPNVFLGPLNLVLYFHSLNLITEDEKKVIKEELHSMLDSMEKEIRCEDLLDVRNFYYLSNLNIDVNSGYYSWNDNTASFFSFNFFNRIVINKPEIYEAHKEWFLSLKRHSILITGSDEMAQAKYFRKQREYVNRL